MNKLTRCDLTNNLCDKFPQLPAQQVKAAVRAVFAQIRASFASGDDMEIRGFGSFTIRTMPPRKGHNPRTGEEVQVPERRKIRFKSSLLLRKMLNPQEKKPTKPPKKMVKSLDGKQSKAQKTRPLEQARTNIRASSRVKTRTP